MVKYTYNAWGNHKVLDSNGVENTQTTFIGNINPYRYRGYYYDTETGLYFLKTRYYDPTVGRFISMDDVAYIDPETIGGTNLFAYCNNNPVMNSDPTGHSAILTGLIIGAIVGAIIGGVYGGITAAANNQNVTAGILIGAFAGGIMGAGAGVASVYLAPVLVGQAAIVGGTTFSTGAALAIGTSIAFSSGVVGGVAADMLTQVSNVGKINDWNSVIWSGIQWGAINTLSAFASSLAGPVSTLESALLSGLFGNVTSAIGMTIDMLRNIPNRKKYYTPLYNR